MDFNMVFNMDFDTVYNVDFYMIIMWIFDVVLYVFFCFCKHWLSAPPTATPRAGTPALAAKAPSARPLPSFPGQALGLGRVQGGLGVTH